jgi:alkylation response protein AidB-like acyl-CoA dehydrogenase
MDFTFDEGQQAVSELTGQILGDKLAPERLRQLETDSDGEWFARDAWGELAKAGLLGIGLPDDVGGGGLGFLEVCLVLEQQGRTVAPLPLLPTLVLGALPIARFGSDEQRKAILPPVIAGDSVLSAAFDEEGTSAVGDRPATTATADNGGWRLDGEKVLVPAAHLADRILVPARTGEATTTVFLVDPGADGVELERNVLFTGEPRATLRFHGVAAGAGDVLGDPAAGHEIVAWTVARAVAGLCWMQAGVCEAALRLTASYVSEREQFGVKIGTFQAVAQRIADAYIDTEAIRLTALQAAWRLAEDLPADDEVHIAKFWASDGGHRVVHAAQHLHGGIGVDLDYPVHRYFRWAKLVELTFGSATDHLRGLGARLAAEPI